MSNRTVSPAREELNRLRQAEIDEKKAKEQHIRDLERAAAAEEAQSYRDQLARDSQQNFALITANQEAIQAAFAEMDKAFNLVKDLKLDGGAIDQTFASQQQHANAAIRRYADVAGEMPGIGRPLNNLSDDEQRQLNAWRARYGQAEGHATSQLPPALPVWAAVQAWIAAGTTPELRTLRSRLVFVITGQLVEVGESYDPRADVVTQQRHQRLERGRTF